MKSADFAAACGVTAQSQSGYENGKGYPNAEYLMKACELGADPAFLLMGTPSHPTMLALSEDEKAPIVAFHGLPPKVRKAMMALATVMKDEK